MPAQATLRFDIQAVLDAAVFASSVRQDLQTNATFQFANGTAADQIKNAYVAQRTLAASASEDLDLSGSLVNALGATILFTKIRLIWVRAAATNANNVVVGGAASNGFFGHVGAATHTDIVTPGGLLVKVANHAAGWPVVAGTGDLLRIANGGAGTPVTYDIVLLGTD